MKIWLINHYAVPPQYYPLARPSLFAKNLITLGNDVTIIAASTVHNSESLNLIEGNERVRRMVDDGVPYVLINCTPYQGNGVKRVQNIWEFSRRLPRVLDTLEKPDAIVATSFDPFTCYEGIKYAKKRGIKAVAEIADLWPETLIAYNGISPNNPVVKYLRNIEKKIYTQADAIVFTMEGAYDYIAEQGWENDIPISKVHYINNGVDLEQFDYNKEHYQIKDADLNDPDIFKVVYTGSIRKVNNVGALLDAAKLIKNERVRFLIWGAGDELEELKSRVQSEKIRNVVFKGFVEKKYIPYIVSKADLNVLPGETHALYRFGLSPNKMFDYFAGGRPTLVGFGAKYNPVVMYNAGSMIEDSMPQSVAAEIDRYALMEENEYKAYCENALRAAQDYDFCNLTKRLLKIIES